MTGSWEPQHDAGNQTGSSGRAPIMVLNHSATSPASWGTLTGIGEPGIIAIKVYWTGQPFPTELGTTSTKVRGTDPQCEHRPTSLHGCCSNSFVNLRESQCFSQGHYCRDELENISPATILNHNPERSKGRN